MPCQICGNYSSYYPLCKDCFKLKDSGEVSKCESCASWFKGKDSSCPQCQSEHQAATKKTILSIYEEVLSKAWDDGILTDDEKKLLHSLRTHLKISEEEHAELEKPIRESVEGLNRFVKEAQKTENELENDFRKKFPPKYRTKDGHFVRSKDERWIDDWLYDHKIPHSYEDKLLGTNIYCDFFLPFGKGIYVEYWGLEERADYSKRMNQKIKFYDEKQLTRIDIHRKHMEDPNTHVPEIFRKFLPGEYLY